MGITPLRIYHGRWLIAPFVIPTQRHRKHIFHSRCNNVVPIKMNELLESEIISSWKKET